MKIAMLGAPRLTGRCFGLFLLLMAAVNCGCSGINVSKSVSPLDFLLPGLMQNDPPRPLMPGGTNVLVCWEGGVASSANR